MNSRPIGIFDSGVGGMTVLAEIAKELPNEDLIYLGDTKNFPYGDKSKENIIKISKKCVEFLISKNVKLIIIACGTATSQALEELRKEFTIPILGIISPTVDSIKKGVKESSKSIIGVIATEGTIRSNKWEQELKEKIEDITVRGFSSITFIIGGTLGLTDDVLQKSNELICFSKMTFPHQLIRVFLLEQVFRAFKISNNETYHW